MGTAAGGAQGRARRSDGLRGYRQHQGRKVFGGRPFLGTVARFRHSLYLKEYVDGDKAEYTGKELAPILQLKVSEIRDPRWWHYCRLA